MAGDIVYFRGGLYHPAADGVAEWQQNPTWDAVAWNPQHSGTEGNPITFMAYPDETPIFETYANGPVLGSVRRDYIVWDGFQITKSISHHAQIGIFYGADHCVIQNMVVEGYESCPATDNGMILFAEFSTHLTIRNCRFFNNTGAGLNAAAVKFYSISQALVENNEFHGNYTGIHDKDGAQYNTYRYNYFHGQHGTNFLLHTDAAGPEPTGVTVYQNVFVGGAIGISINGDRPKHDITVYNNTIYDPLTVGIFTNATVNNFTAYNNIVCQTQYLLFYSPYHPDGSLPGLNSNHNCAYAGSPVFRYQGNRTYYSLSAWQSGTGQDMDSLAADPLFINAGGGSAADYALSPDSPCRSTGRNSAAMGAYITGNEIIGLQPDSAAAKPTNLRLLDH
jgi:hypothetical protein